MCRVHGGTGFCGCVCNRHAHLQADKSLSDGAAVAPLPRVLGGGGGGGVGMQADGAPDQVGSREQGAGAAVSPALPGAGL